MEMEMEMEMEIIEQRSVEAKASCT
jgi:hypothetical protein